MKTKKQIEREIRILKKLSTEKSDKKIVFYFVPLAKIEALKWVLKSFLLPIVLGLMLGGCINDYNLKKINAYYNKKSMRVTINIPCYRLVPCTACVKEGKFMCEDYYAEIDLKTNSFGKETAR